MTGFPEKVYRAGMIPYHIDDENQVWMMFMKPIATEWSGDAFQIAKGRCDPGEHHSDTAVREAKEELGLFEGNIVDGPHHIGRFLGRTDMYICEVMDQEMFGEASDETDETAWMTLVEFFDEGRELHRPVVQECYREICRLNQLEHEIQLSWRP